MSVKTEDIVILLVEDSDEDRSLIVSILSKYFKKILEAPNGKIAYELYKENKDIDIIISDIDMPEVDGLDLLKLVRLIDLNIPFVITTAQINSELLLKAIDLNVTSFLLKPIDLSKLLEKIDILCEKKLIEKKLSNKQSEIENYLQAVDKVALIYKMNEDGNITYMNKSMLEISKYKESEIEALQFKDIIHPDIPKKFIDETWDHIKSGKLWKGSTKFIAKNNEFFYLKNTVFQIKDENHENEYITISFLTTKENLAKRDFHRKVLLNIQEANRKELELNEKLKKITFELHNANEIIKKNDPANLEELESRVITKEKQIQKYEKEIAEQNDKYDKMLKNKKDELEHHINQLQPYRISIDNLTKEVETKTKDLKVAHNKIKKLIQVIEQRDKRIRDLEDVVDFMEKEQAEAEEKANKK